MVGQSDAKAALVIGDLALRKLGLRDFLTTGVADAMAKTLKTQKGREVVVIYISMTFDVRSVSNEDLMNMSEKVLGELT